MNINYHPEQYRQEEEELEHVDEVAETQEATAEYECNAPLSTSSTSPNTNTGGTHTDRIALTICLALGFFTILFVLSLVLMVNLIVQYGFIIFTAITLLCCIVLPGGWYLLNHVLLPQDSNMQRAKSTLLYCWNKAVKEVILQEFHNFQLDIHEHYLLLTNGNQYSNDNAHTEQEDSVTIDPTQPQHHQASTDTQQNRKKSVLFQFIKPLLPRRHKQQKQQQEQHELSTKTIGKKKRPKRASVSTITTNSTNAPSYEPPSNSYSSIIPLQ